MENRFLQEFMKMRKGLAEKASGNVPTGLIPIAKPATAAGVSYRTIVETKPRDSVVLNYLRDKIKTIVDEEEEIEEAKAAKRR